MAQRLLLEGPDPAALVAQVRRELGTEVEVVQSERVRSGGVLGFFSRESYAVTVEVPDAAPATAVMTAAVASEDADVAAARRELLGADASESCAAQLAEARGAGRGRGFVAAQFPSVAPTSPAAPTSPVAPSVATPPQAAKAAHHAGAASVLTAARAAAAVQARSLTADGDARGASGSPVASDASVASHAPAVLEEPLSQALRSADARRAGASVTLSATRETGIVVGPWSAPAVDDAPPVGPTAGMLLRAGLPDRVIDAARLDETVPWTALMARLGAGATPRLEPGAIIALVGDPAEVLQVAFQVAAWSRTPLADIVLAGTSPAIPGHGRRITSETAASRLRERAEAAAADGRPVIVAVGTSAGAKAGAVAAGLVDAMDADHVWAVTDAGLAERDRDERVRHLGGVGVIDAIALVGAAHSHAPAAALGAGLPVAWIDGVPASPMAWVALIAERLSLP
ncbi:MAG: hypothetical protein ACK5IM_12890 [Demequina sp.]|uniref:hypothetical protein n=1 Tax=Demequina sp. TaxID=2050685 RepID=UPI003A8A0B8A